MKDQGKKISEMMKNFSDMERLSEQGVNVESLRQSIKDKSSAIAGNKIVEK